MAKDGELSIFIERQASRGLLWLLRPMRVLDEDHNGKERLVPASQQLSDL